MNTPPTPLRLNAIYVDPEDETETVLGEVAVSPDGQVSVISAHQEHLGFLEEFANAVNQKAVLHVKTAPPPGAPMFQLRGRAYDRSDPKFVEGLKLWAGKYYALKLCTDEERSQELKQLEDLSL